MADSEFEAMIARDREHDRTVSRAVPQATRQGRRDRELEEMIKAIEAEAARDEKRNRPVQIKRFEVG